MLHTPSPDGVVFLQGTLTTVDTTLVNPYSGVAVPLAGDFYVNDALASCPGAGTDDTLIASGDDQYFRLEDDAGTLLFDGFEHYITGNGNDYLVLANATRTLPELLLLGGEGDDLVWSNAGDDALEGNNGNDILDGGPGNDTLDGGADEDRLTGGEGDDFLDGGSEVDTAVFSGSFNDYTRTEVNGDTIWVDCVGTDGVDTARNVERFEFADGTYENGVFTPNASAVPTLGATGAWLLAAGFVLAGLATLRRRATGRLARA